MKIKTKPIVYEIEVLKTERPIPKDQEIDFIEWLSYQPSECANGTNYEYFSYTDNYKEDIGVKFYIMPVSSE